MQSTSFSCFLVCLLLSLCSSSFLSSCGVERDSVFDVVYNPCEPLVIETPASTKQAELESIDEALEMWREAASLQLSRETGNGLTEDGARIPVSFESGAAMIHGYYDDESGEVIINRNLNSKKARAITLAHELGHAFGLPHIAADKRRSLMNAGNIDTSITSADAQALLKRWNHCQSEDSAP